MKIHRLAAVAILVTASCARPLPPAEPAMVVEWMQNYYGLIRAERISPPVASRVLAYAAVALYEGLATGIPSLRSLAGQLNGLDSLPEPEPGQVHDPVLVALAAEHTVLDSLFVEALPATRAALAGLVDSLARARIALGISQAIQDRSDQLGTRIGTAILEWASHDGFNETRTRPYSPPVGPQYWVNDSRADEYVPQNLSAATDYVALDNPSAAFQPGAASERGLMVNRPKPAGIRTLKALNPAGVTEPWWGTLRPFVLTAPDECPATPPAEYSPDGHSAFRAEAERVYQAGRSLTEEQRLIALYWADNPGQTGTPVGHWLSIASQTVDQLQLPVERAAEAFVLATLAQADAFIAAWRTKFDTNVMRPVTYIRRHMDPRWEPYIVTPPFPEYPSAHSVQSRAAATVLQALLGAVAFDDSTNLAIGHPVRRFRSFIEAGDEAALSRLYGGIHYPMAVENGKAQGACVGRKVLERVQTRRAR